MGEYPEILRRFKAETAEHEMTVSHDDGPYRHLQFRHTGTHYSGYYWFDLITVPGALIFQGDGDGFIFQRVEDMFEFFRGPVGRINPAYWQQKVVSGREGLLAYSEKAFRDKVIEEFRDACAVGVPRGTGRALREQILDDNYAEVHYEQGARETAELFEHDGFEFSGVDDWDLTDFNWWFLWACHAIVWGIAYYDTKARPAVPEPAPAKARPKVRPEPRVVVETPQPSRQLPAMVGGRRIVDVHLPEPDSESTDLAVLHEHGLTRHQTGPLQSAGHDTAEAVAELVDAHRTTPARSLSTLAGLSGMGPRRLALVCAAVDSWRAVTS